MKTPLEELSVPTPRPAALCMRLARRLDPGWGFAFAALIWVVIAGTITMIVLMRLMDVLDVADGSTSAKVLTLIVMPLGAYGGYRAFVWWRRSRLALKERLLRDGKLEEATVIGRPWKADVRVSEVRLRVAGRELHCTFNRWFAPDEGTTIRLLHTPATHHVVAFDRHGAMYSGHVTGA